MSESTSAGAANAPASSFVVEPEFSTPAHRNPAVERCLQARTATMKSELRKGSATYDAEKAGIEAYRAAMPDLSGIENIQDFIACVAQGMILDAFHFRDSSQLLYAAQVAITSVRRQAKSTPIKRENTPSPSPRNLSI